MDFWIKAAQLILSLSILIVLHEFGHFIPARLFKIKVEKFYLFFDWKFSLLKKKIGETTWGIGWIPLGGYVKIAGMIDESMDKDQMAKPAQPWEFRSKPAWQRLIVMIGGVVVNVIVGMLIYIFVLFTWGEDQLKPSDLQSGLTVHPYLEQFGLKSGDNILAVDGEAIYNVNEINNEILLRDKHNLKVKHADGSIETVVLPEGIEYKLFTEGALRSISLRHKSTTINHLITTKDNEEIGIKQHDVFLSINGQSPDGQSLKVLVGNAESFPVELIRKGDTITVDLSSKNMDQLGATAPALNAGFAEGDQILEVDGRSITYFDEIVSALYPNKGKKVEASVLRDSDTVLLTVPVTKLGSIGFAPVDVNPEDLKSVKKIYYSFGESIGRGIQKGYTTLSDYASQMKFLFTKKGVSSMGGFGTLGKLFPSTWDWEIFWLNTALISIILAFMNILPIPALDGGHVVFLIYEIITGREAPQKVLEIAQYIGFFLILGLVLYANGNDIYNWLFN
jgi:regulator of sigma E protease